MTYRCQLISSLFGYRTYLFKNILQLISIELKSHFNNINSAPEGRTSEHELCHRAVLEISAVRKGRALEKNLRGEAVALRV